MSESLNVAQPSHINALTVFIRFRELVGPVKALLIITDVNIQCRSRFKRNPDKITLMDLFVEAGRGISV